jgi:hypothetical protein
MVENAGSLKQKQALIAFEQELSEPLRQEESYRMLTPSRHGR